jgi:predicted enzyme related to lactoylglutathione lyase
VNYLNVDYNVWMWIIMDYDNFFLPIDNLEEAKKFYEEIIGLQLKFDFEDKGMIAYNVGDNEPAIILKDKRKFKDLKPTIWFVVDDVTKTYEKLSLKKVKFLSKPFKIATGTAVEFEDPFGNRLGITDYNNI